MYEIDPMDEAKIKRELDEIKEFYRKKREKEAPTLFNAQD